MKFCCLKVIEKLLKKHKELRFQFFLISFSLKIWIDLVFHKYWMNGGKNMIKNFIDKYAADLFEYKHVWHWSNISDTIRKKLRILIQ